MQKYCINKYNRFNKIILNDMQVCENGCIYNSRERDLAKKKKKKKVILKHLSWSA